MKTGTPHLKVAERRAGTPQSTLARDLAFALAAAVILLAGMLCDVVSAQTPTTVTAEVEVARPPRETVFFPSQHVNQGREIPEPAPTF